jgi:phytoene dehydrogenase-like protein
MEALIRLSTYTNNPEVLSAGAALAQLQLGLRGVDYVDGGWISLVEGLEAIAKNNGAEFRLGTRIHAILDPEDPVLFAGPPDPLHQTTPVYVSTLDLGLDHLPEPGHTFALGIDQPYYFSVHSKFANLAPQGSAMVHVAKYGTGTRSELEVILDRVQKGWRDHVIHARFMPNILVSNAIVSAERGGLAGRTAVDGANRANTYFAGDWVGAEGMLADAAVASGRKAAAMILNANHPVRELQIA